MTSLVCYTLFILATGLERLVEVWVSNKHAVWSFSQGGKEYGQSHYPFMVALHTGFLFACVFEVWFMERSFNLYVGYSLVFLALGCQALRWWCITTLGTRWNTRVIIVPGLQRVSDGPYRFFTHPNYVAVVVEGVVLPMIHNAWLSAITFTVLNALLLIVRINVENTALKEMENIG